MNPHRRIFSAIALFVVIGAGISSFRSAGDVRTADGRLEDSLLSRSEDTKKAAALGVAVSEGTASDFLSHEEPQAYQEWFMQQRLDPNGEIPTGALQRAFAETARLRATAQPQTSAKSGEQAASAESGADANWSPLLPTQITVNNVPAIERSGRVSAIATDPTNQDRLFVGLASGGVWRTTTGGNGWTPVFDSVVTQAIGAIAIDPNNSNNVFVGTGDAESIPFTSYYGDGVYKSTDGGGSWNKLNGPAWDGCKISDIAVRKGDSNQVLVSLGGFSGGPTGSREAVCGLQKGVWRSTDGGLTFSRVMDPGPWGNGVSDLEAAPQEGTGFVYAALLGFGVKRSTDFGATWSDFFVRDELIQSYSKRIELASSKVEPGRLIVAVPANGFATNIFVRKPDGSVVVMAGDGVQIDQSATTEATRSCPVRTSSTEAPTTTISTAGSAATR